MTETLFYHLERRALVVVLPGWVENSRQRGWKALIRADTADRADAIDTLLWTYDDQSFLAHAQAGDGEASRQPVLITVEEGNPNAAEIHFYVGGAQPGDWSTHNTLTRIGGRGGGRGAAARAAARAAGGGAGAAGRGGADGK